MTLQWCFLAWRVLAIKRAYNYYSACFVIFDLIYTKISLKNWLLRKISKSKLRPFHHLFVYYVNNHIFNLTPIHIYKFVIVIVLK